MFESWKDWGIKPNELVNEGQNCDGKNDTSKYTRPSARHDQDQHKKAKTWRREAKKAEDGIARRILCTHARKNTYKLYKRCDKVFVWVGRKNGRLIRNYRVINRTILKQYEDDANYQVKLQLPEAEFPTIKTNRVEDIADLPSDGMRSRKSKRSFEKLLIPLTRSNHTHQFRNQGHAVEYDSPSDEKCQFWAISFALSQMEIFRSAETLRSDAASYLRDTKIMGGVPTGLFAAVSLEQHLY